ncbi:MAG TPA: FAD-binding protein [Streptosporangiaceae bacterium]|nr:FAD-binding protein [Streptosporangiaceae bacterium]
MTGNRTNWAGNVTFGAERFHRPSSLPELQELVARSTRIRALGAGHSFNRLADTPGDLVSLAGLPRLIEIDPAGASVTVGAGVRYTEVAAALHRAGRALRNLASLPHISVAGACATATHGSGDGNGNLATAVAAVQMITADGHVETVSRAADQARFAGIVVGLGAAGIVTRLTLDTVPVFYIRQYVYEDLPYEQVSRHFEEIMSSAYSVSLFTDWRAPRIRQAWLKRRADAADAWAPRPRWMGGRLADGPRHPVPGMPPEHCTEQLGAPGPWHERLPHFRPDFAPSSGEELQSEFLMPRAGAIAALDALRPIAGRLAPVVQISEIRTVAPDQLWLSPSYLRDTVGFHFTWVKDWAAVEPVLAEVEERLAPLHARPHWGKLFATSPAVVRGLYPRLDDFRRLAHEYDPAGKFRNDLLDRYVPPPHR